ncbi:MAG TPA: CBS domain-containing protein [Candidatus Binatus sp.]|nr:CBS domain-containing protein [Candidatus Binatus sp.]
MSKVKDVMKHDIPRVGSSATILEAANVMNRARASAAVVVEGEKVVGMLSDRGLLRKFIPLNKRPDEVKIGDLMVPLLRVDPETSTKVAAKKILQSGYTRIGVFEDEKLLGWVTLTDLAREFSKQGLLDALRVHNEPEERQVLCPNCQSGFLEKIVTREGKITNWKCPKCGYAL